MLASSPRSLLAGRYALGRLLGAGGFGAVHAAFDEELQACVALKILSKSGPAKIGRFKREFRALASLTHPNLVVLHELACDDGVWFYTMELVEGGDLASWVKGPTTKSAETLT